MRYDLHVHTLTSTITLKYQTNILVSNTKYADNMRYLYTGSRRRQVVLFQGNFLFSSKAVFVQPQNEE